LNKSAISNWLWYYRKLLLFVGLLLVALELIYFFPTWLFSVALVILVMIGAFVWWIGNLKATKAVWLFVCELVWTIFAGIGFLIFSLLTLWQTQLVIALIVFLAGLVVYWHQNSIDNKQWDLAAVNWLSLVNLLVMFLATATLMLTVQFYSLGVFWLMIGIGIQLVLALYLLFWRQGMPDKKFWLYAVLLAWVGEQLIWITHAWHKSIYLKAFLFVVIYYLYSDFVAHYLRGNLTAKIIFEYIVIAVVLILVIFLFDWIFLLIPSIV